MSNAAGSAHRSSDARVRDDDERGCGVEQALRMSGPAAIEVYVGWSGEPVHAAAHASRAGAETWALVGPRLKERVLLAISPLLIMGWQINGVFAQAVRWDMADGVDEDRYDGCWVRIRRTR